MNLFSKMKINEHNLKLEKILELKYFSSNAKSLLLSMIYKIENSYDDYKEIKHINKPKEEIVEEIINIIRDYCDNIKIVEPHSEESEIIKKNKVFAMTNSRERSILAYPTEISLLYAIIDILPKYFYVEDNFVFKNAMQTVLVNGINQNILEILSDFNGWSWDINLEYKNDLFSNLIYQNLIIIFGQEYMDSWLEQSNSRRSTIVELRRKLKETNYFSYLCKFLYTISNKDDKKRIEEKYTFKEESKSNIIIKMQLEFVKYLVQIANQLDDTEDIIRLIYQIRYYRELYINSKTKIKNIEKIESKLNEVYKIIITKACKKAILRIINLDIEANYKIIKQALDTKIISLDDVKIKLNLEADKLFICIYENDILERKLEIEDSINKKDLGIKLNKKYSLFN